MCYFSRNSKKKATGSAASGAESASGQDEPSNDPALEQPASEPAEEVAPKSGTPAVEVELPGTGTEAVGDPDKQPGESGPPPAEEASDKAAIPGADPTTEVPEVPAPAAVPATSMEIQIAPAPATVSGSSAEETPLASRLEAMASGASGFSKVRTFLTLYCLVNPHYI